MNRSRIMVVDDEPGMLRSVERLLKSDYRVVGVATPLEALETAASFMPDLAVLDIRMPGMDGFELTRRLKALQPGMDVILMTGSIQEVDQQLTRALREKAFYFIQKPFDREVFLTLVSRCLDLRRLEEENRAHTRRLESSLSEARAFQKSLLPPETSRVGTVSFAARCIPCDGLAGDFYDYAGSRDGHAAFVLGDVSGHGVSAAMLTGVLKSSFQASQAEGYEPTAVVRRVAEAMQAFGTGRFITLFSGRIHQEEGWLEFVNAGHPPGVRWGPSGEPTALDSNGPMVSPIFGADAWETQRVPFGPENHLLIYTDGVEEAQCEQEMFGMHRVLECVRLHRVGGSHLLDGMLHSVRRFAGGRPHDDDITMLTVKSEDE